MDVVLISLLFNDINFIKKEILEKNIQLNIQNELILLKNGFRPNCLEFKNHLNKLESYEDFSDNDQKDADEFLKYLFRIFEVNCCKNKELTYILKDDGNFEFIGCNINDKLSPIVEIDSFNNNSIIESLKEPNYFEVDNFIYKGQDYKKIKKSIIFVEYDMMIINLRRFCLNGFVNKKIIPNQNLILYSNNKLELNSIIIWKDHHYSSFIEIDKIWFYYDDTIHDFQRIGNYSDLIKIDLVLTNSILVFYV